MTTSRRMKAHENEAVVQMQMFCTELAASPLNNTECLEAMTAALGFLHGKVRFSVAGMFAVSGRAPQDAADLILEIERAAEAQAEQWANHLGERLGPFPGFDVPKN